MRRKTITLLGAGALAVSLAAAPLRASADPGDEALAFMVGTAVGYAIGDHDHHRVHYAHRAHRGHAPVVRYSRPLYWHGGHRYHKPNHGHHYGHHKHRHDRRDHRWDRRDGRRDHHDGRRGDHRRR